MNDIKKPFRIHYLYQPWIKVDIDKNSEGELTLVNKVNCWNLISFLKQESKIPVVFSLFFEVNDSFYEVGINTDNTYFLFELISSNYSEKADRLFFYRTSVEKFLERFKRLYEKYDKPKVNFFLGGSNIVATPYSNALIFENELDKVFWLKEKEGSLYDYYDNLYVDHYLSKIFPFMENEKVIEIGLNHIYYNTKKDKEKNMFYTVYADLSFDADSITAFWNRMENIKMENRFFENPDINKEKIHSIAYTEFPLTTPIYDESNFEFDEDFLNKYGEQYKVMDFDTKSIIYFRYKTLKGLYNYLMNYLSDLPEERKQSLHNYLMANVFNDSYKEILPLITDEVKGDTEQLEKIILEKNYQKDVFNHLMNDFDIELTIYNKKLHLNDYIRLYEIEFFVLYLQGYIWYLLITADFCKWSERKSIIVWPWRGSAGGSLLVFLVWITTIDPLPFDLLFYRFLNPSRISPPDIDLDFEDTKRDFPILYCQEKYGFENTCKIWTYMAYQFKNTFKSLCKFLGVPFSMANQMASKLDDFKDKLKEIFAIDISLEKEGEEDELDGDSLDMAITESQGVKYSDDLLVPIEELTIELIDASEINFLNSSIDAQTLKEKVIKVFLAEPYLYKQIFNAGIHACGTVISPKVVLPYYKKDINEIWKDNTLTYRNFKEVFPWRNAEELEIAISYLSWPELEDQWYLKFDFLGLKNLSIIGDIAKELKVKNVRQWVNDMIFHKMSDDVVYKNIFSKGLTTGVFQFESLGMKKYLKELQPTNIEDLIAMVSLYRPWPMAFIPSYIARKKGEEEIKAIPDELKEKLVEKYGKEKTEDYSKRLHDIFVKNSNGTFFICVYQEQLMKLSQYYAGFTMSQADNLRKIIGKKKIDKIPALYEEFKEGARQQDFPDEITEYIFKNVIEPAASYSFNKSHAACYAIIAYINGYLKYYYPLEFYKALLNFNIKEPEKIFLVLQDLYLNDNISLNIELPDLKNLQDYCRINQEERKVILGGLAMKGLSKNFLNEHIEKNNITTFEDFFEKYDNVSKKDIESIIKSLFIFSKGFLKNQEAEKKFYNYVEEIIDRNNIDRKYEKYIANIFLNKILLDNSKAIVDELKGQKKNMQKFLDKNPAMGLFWNTLDLVQDSVDFKTKILYEEIDHFMNVHPKMDIKTLKRFIKENINGTIIANWYDVTLIDKIKLLLSFENIDFNSLEIYSLDDIEKKNNILKEEYKIKKQEYEKKMQEIIDNEGNQTSENTANLIMKDKKEKVELPEAPKMQEALYDTILLVKEIKTIEMGADISKTVTDIFLSKNMKIRANGYKAKIENFNFLKENINNIFWGKVDQYNKILYMEEI